MHYKQEHGDGTRVKHINALITYMMSYKIDDYCKQNNVTRSTAIYELLGKGLENEEK